MKSSCNAVLQKMNYQSLLTFGETKMAKYTVDVINTRSNFMGYCDIDLISIVIGNQDIMYTICIVDPQAQRNLYSHSIRDPRASRMLYNHLLDNEYRITDISSLLEISYEFNRRGE